MNWTTLALMVLRYVVASGGGAAVLDAFMNGDWKTGAAGIAGIVAALLGSLKNKANAANAVAAAGQNTKGL